MNEGYFDSSARSGGVFSTGLLFVALAFVAFLVVGAMAYPYITTIEPQQATIRLPDIVVDPGPDGSPHAHKHPEADDIRHCLEKNGAYMIYRSFDRRSFYALCQLPDGRWGFREFVQDAVDKLWHEVTAFVPRDGKLSSVMNYLSRSGTRFKGPFPWE